MPNVYAETPSATADPRIVEPVDGAVVSWHPERGWLCSEHLPQPCLHTADLTVGKDPEWNQ